MNKLYIVGIGPGELEQMTYAAAEAIKESELIVGYQVYADLLRDLFPQKQYYVSGMTQERQRVQYAIEQAQQGKTTALVSSGDSGVYGMASLAYELAEKIEEVEIKVIPGITAALSGGALLGAPLGHDFAIISLSDRLTPWEWIEKRLILAAQGDFVLCLYNPSSKKRADYLKRACNILLNYKSKDTICAIAQNIGRQGQKETLTTLKELAELPVDMFTTVFIGNSQTKIIRNKMVTPRGYHHE